MSVLQGDILAGKLRAEKLFGSGASKIDDREKICPSEQGCTQSEVGAVGKW